MTTLAHRHELSPVAAGAMILLPLVVAFAAGYGFDVPLGALPARTAWELSPLGLATGPAGWLTAATSACAVPHFGPYSAGYAWVFLKTVVLEAPFYLFLCRSAGMRSALAVLVFANFLTHPLVYFAFPCLGRSYLTTLLGAEVFAAVVESAFILVAWGQGLVQGSRSFAVAVIVLANLVSWQVGLFF